ncbi:MAG: DUF5110 domain-containing protein [Ruminococcaceae bacterium]|nr:DUF5110 domain-containing protein [Oscillospiraceae bacterium]
MKQENRFRCEMRPVACQENIVLGNTCRFAVLDSRLIRMEYAPNGVFEDRASQMAFFRDFAPCEFAWEKKDGVITVKTEYLLLTCRDGVPFSPETLTVRLLQEPASVWHYGDEIDDLGGTARTLDRVSGSCPLDRGVCSRWGFSVLDDSNALLLNEEDGWIGIRGDNTQDLYFFGFGYDYLAAVKALYKLTGAPPLLPAYALGNWWSRYYAYTQQEYLDLMDRFVEEDLPFSVGVVDMDWHVVKIPEDQKDPNPRFAKGWTGYSWNKELFPDYKAFLKGLKDRNLKTALNLHPAHGTCRHEDMYEEMARANGIDPATGQRVPLDLLSQHHMETYFDILHHPYERDGVDFWWMDWQQGTSYYWIHEENKPGEYADPRERMDPLWMLNHLHILDIERSGKRPMFFSRYAGPGSHRYPVGFSGDTTITWESLEFQPYFTATASNIGYSWWSHDIGGHMLGIQDDELFVRWLQLGVFSPINRLHSSCEPFVHKEPWNHDVLSSKTISDWLRLRHQLFPYIYTMNYRNHEELEPLVQPMYYRYPKVSAAYEVPNQFFFGSELMVAPIVKKADPKALLASTEMWLPAGSWFDFFTGLHYAGGKGRKLTVCRDRSTMPVFAKAGGIVPMAKLTPHDNHLGATADMELLVFPGASNRFVMTEDTGEMLDYKKGAVARTEISLNWGNAPKLTIAAAQGDLSLIPERRNWHIGLRGFYKDVAVNVTANGADIAAETSYEAETNTVWVSVTAASAESIELSITGEKLIHDNCDAMRRCEKMILFAQHTIITKSAMWDIASNAEFPLEEKCLQLNGKYQEQDMLSKAIQEMLSLTEDKYLGCQL